MKSERHSKILEKVEKQEIETQEELLNLLKASGFDVTQATVSRDIRDLRLVKVQATSGKYCYSVHSAPHPIDNLQKLKVLFEQAVIHVDYANNLVVIQCYVGMANAVCVSMDTITWNGVVGTISGDDTILVIMRTNELAKEFVEEVSKLLK